MAGSLVSNMAESVHDDYILSAQWEDGWIHVVVMSLHTMSRLMRESEYWITLCPAVEAAAVRDWDELTESELRALIADPSFP
jgi:hypothetical protein